MEAHNVPMISVLLRLTILLQISAGAAIIAGYKGKIAAFMLAGLTFVISIYMHDFLGYGRLYRTGPRIAEFR